MPKLQLLAPPDQINFDACSKLTNPAETHFSSISVEIENHIDKIRSFVDNDFRGSLF